MTTRTHHLAVATAALALAATAAAQSFTYTDFSNVATLNLLGNAAQSGTAVRLTANAINQTGWAWHRTAMPVISGFDTTFTFRITPGAGGTKAEGMALVIHDDPNGIATLGGTIWGMGYGNGSNGAVGIRNSIAIELDTFQDGFLSDTSSNELTIHTRGPTGNHENEQYSIGRATPATVLSNAAVHSLRVRYTPGLIEVFVDGATTPAISRPYSLLTGGTYLAGGAVPAPTLVNGTAFAGFCATTGANTSLTELVEILSWTWNSTPLRDPCYAGTLGENVLFVNGSSGGLLRSIDLATFQPFDVEMRAPTSTGPGAPWAMAASLAPNPAAPGAATPFGNLCMPVLPFGPTEFVFADAFGAFAPIVTAGPVPYTISIPQSVLTFSLDVTLQSVIAIPTSPGLAITNAVDLRFRPSLPPVITTVAPLSATAGAPITITGQRFLSGCTVAVNGTPVVPTSRTDTQIVFPYPVGVPCGSSLSVSLLDGQSATTPFNPSPVVTSTALNSGTAAGNQLFVITGTGFSAGTTVTIGGAAAAIQSVSAVSILVRTPAGTPGPAQVVVTTPGGCTTTTTYTYL